MSEPSRLILVRHGQTDLNRDRRFRGLSDAPLNDAGLAEARGAAALLTRYDIETVHTSPVPRSKQTAAVIAEAVGRPVVEDEGLTDIDYGDWQGLTVEEVEERFGRDVLDSWRRDPGSFRFPGGESIAAVQERLAPTMLRLVRERPGGTVVAVSHLAVLKLCFLVLLGLPPAYFWRVIIDNGAASVFDHTEADGFVLRCWNLPPVAGV